MKKLLISIFLVSLIGCATTDSLYKWEGKKFDDMLIAWGNPHNHAELSDGRLMVEYVSHYCNVRVLIKNQIITSVKPEDKMGCTDMRFHSSRPPPA